MNRVNHQVIFQRRPDGVPTQDIFSFAESPLPQPGPNEIEQVPAAFFRMLRGENDGKQLVRLVNEEAGE